jgi:dTDP-4-dehydrorhamnose reductase
MWLKILSMSNILLLGHKGYIGSFLHEKLNVDILEDRNVYCNNKDYKYIINCIGKPDVEYCECNKEETDYSNMNVIDDIVRYYPKSKIINFSSYYVYDDYGMCSENANVTYEYQYTKQKLASEIKNKNGVTFRVGKLFGNTDINKQNKLTEYIIKNQELILDGISFNPTSLNQIYNVIEYELYKNNLFGIFNLANDGITTHFEYGNFINKHIKNSNKKINKIESFNKYKNYGKFTMSCEKIKKHIKLIDWKVDMIDYLNNLYL